MNEMNTLPDGTQETNIPESSRQKPVQHKKGLFAKKTCALTLSAVLFGTVSAGTFYGVDQLLQGDNTSGGTSAGSAVTTVASTSRSGTRSGMDVSDIAAEALPSVVAITNISVQEVQSYFNRFGPNGGGQPQLRETTSCGSGVIIAEDDTHLYMVTNAHVVEDATTLSVSFVDNAVCEAKLCGTDEEMDLAVIKVEKSDLSSNTLEQIKVIEVGDSDALEVGEQVVAIGNALGYGQSVTTGIVSALDRSLTNENGTTSTYIQTDAAINPGNSGGALLNLDGELVGINTAKLSDTDVEGMGYAIPISDAADLILELMTQNTELKQAASGSSQQTIRQMPGQRWN
jgi:serine protease Do